MTRDDRLRIAVFIDFDNIEIGVKNTLGASFDAGLVLEALRERGDVVSKTAYSDWQRAGNYSRMLTQHAIKMVQRNLTPGGDKNGADINLALDALEMAFTHPHINGFVIVGGDSDFISLVEKLKQYDKKVFVVGGRQFTSIIMQRNCHEFIAYENLVGTTASSGGRRQPGRGVRVDRAPIEQAIPLVNRALEVLSEREVSPQLGLLKTTLLQLDSTFSERDYGAGSFRDFAAKLEKLGVVKVQQAKGGLLVGPGDSAAPPVGEAAPPAEEPDSGHPVEAPRNGRGQADAEAPPVTGTAAEGLAEFRRILALGQVRRWPMYLRNVKQMIRQVNADFDERAYGYANLVDLLRAAGRENVVRVDRDRQGVIRVFQGAAPVSEAQPTAAEVAAPAAEVVEDTEVPAAEVSPDQRAVVIEFPAADEEPDDDIGNRAPAAETKAPARKSTRRRRSNAGGGDNAAGAKKTSATRARTSRAPRRAAADKAATDGGAEPKPAARRTTRSRRTRTPKSPAGE